MYPQAYSAIRELIRGEVLKSEVARSVIRKSGFRPGTQPPGDRSGLGAPVLSIPPVVYVSEGTVSEPV